MKLLLCLVPGLLLGQSNWMVPPEFASAGYRRETLPEGILLSGPGPSGALTESFDAAPYRGQPVRLRASVRVEGAGKAQLQLRVDRSGGKLGFFDNMGDRPIVSTEWTAYELSGEVAPDAESIEVGVLSSGAASVWVKDILFEKQPPARPETAAAREAIVASYASVDAAYAAGDAAAITALAMPDAEVVLLSGAVSLRAALSQLAEAKFRSHSEVTAVRVAGAEATGFVPAIGSIQTAQPTMPQPMFAASLRLNHSLPACACIPTRRMCAWLITSAATLPRRDTPSWSATRCPLACSGSRW